MVPDHIHKAEACDDRQYGKAGDEVSNDKPSGRPYHCSLKHQYRRWNGGIGPHRKGLTMLEKAMVAPMINAPGEQNHHHADRQNVQYGRIGKELPYIQDGQEFVVARLYYNAHHNEKVAATSLPTPCSGPTAQQAHP